MEDARQRLLAFQQRRMRIIETAVKGMGRKVAQVLLIQLAQGADQGAGLVHDLGGEGIRLVHVGDVGRTQDLEAVCKNADALVIEATYLDEEADMADQFAHLTARRAAELAVRVGIKHLILFGVHTNMCVLHRSFAIKQMTRWGVPCVLVDTAGIRRKAKVGKRDDAVEALLDGEVDLPHASRAELAADSSVSLR